MSNYYIPIIFNANLSWARIKIATYHSAYRLGQLGDMILLSGIKHQERFPRMGQGVKFSAL